MYARAGIPESWRIEVGTGRIVVQGAPNDGHYGTEGIVVDPTRMTVHGLPGFEVNLSDLF